MIQYHVAATPDEQDVAQSIIRQVYTREGYTSTDDRSSGLAPYIAANTTTTFLASVNENPVGTVSLVKDSEANLPMDTIFHEELIALRNQYQLLAEVCQFAICRPPQDAGNKKIDRQITFGLLSRVLQRATNESVDCICFTINPKHKPLYESLGAVQVGVEKAYPFVNNAPAIALYLDVIQVQNNKEQLPSFLREILFNPTKDPSPTP